jgi:hypothetical protein
MKKALFAAASAITILASGSVSAQTTMNAPYYANPSWDQQLPAAQRFIVLSNWNNEAVLDRETGLVWQRTPSSVPDSWFAAVDGCRSQTRTGGRMGWRLPSIEEYKSLVDPTQQNPALPPGHPFIGVDPNANYWTATTASFLSPGIVVVQSFGFFAGGGDANAPISGPMLFWCVRGGQGVQAPQ